MARQLAACSACREIANAGPREDIIRALRNVYDEYNVDRPQGRNPVGSEIECQRRYVQTSFAKMPREFDG